MSYTLTSIKKIYDKNFSAAENGTMPATIDFNIAVLFIFNLQK